MLGKVLFLVIVTLPDGSYKSKVNQVNECPPAKVVLDALNHKLKIGEITSFFADCAEFPFFEVKKEGI